MVLAHLRNEGDRYRDIHEGDAHGDMLEFFASRNYNTTIVDILLKICSNSLEVEIVVYKKSNGSVDVLAFNEVDRPGVKRIFLLFNENPMYPVANHYDAIVKKDKTHIVLERKTSLQKVCSTESVNVISEVLQNADKVSRMANTQVESVSSEGNEADVDTDSPVDLSQPSSRESGLVYSANEARNHNNYIRSLVSEEQVMSRVQEDEEEPPEVIEDLDFSEVEMSQTQQFGLNKGDPFPTWEFQFEVPETVEEIPEDIDGRKAYVIYTTPDKFSQVSSDRRHFVMSASGAKIKGGWRRLGWCQGSYICVNNNCPFWKTSKKRNRGSFKKSASKATCTSCGYFGLRKKCVARKLVDVYEAGGLVVVYHIGKHNCIPKVNCRRRREQMEDIIRQNIGRVAPEALRRERVMLK